MKEQTSKKPSHSLFIADVRNWDLMLSEALGFLDEREIEGLKQTTIAFIDNSYKGHRAGRTKEVNEPEERRRRETLAFVFTSEFEKAPLEEQKRLIEEACLKTARYNVIQDQVWKRFESAKTHEELKRAGREADALVNKMDLKIFHEGKTFLQQAEAKIDARLRREALRIKREKGEVI